MNDGKTESIKYLNVEISRKGVSKVYGARVERFIPRDEVRVLHVKYGYPGERAWLQLGLATLLLGAAAIQIADLLFWLLGGGTRYTSNILVLFVLIGLGGWLLWDVLHPQWYLEVHTPEKVRKFAFNQRVDLMLFSTFLTYAKEMGYFIDTSVFDARTSEQPGKRT